MLFITNRVFRQSPRSRAGRNVDFDLRNTDALQSLFFCRRHGPDEYEEVTSIPFLQEINDANEDHILIYIHGFNNTPEDVFKTLRPIERTLGKRIMVVPIIWPCRKGDDNDDWIIEEYYDDQQAADATGLSVARALMKFWEWQHSRESECQKRINVLSHSMGNRILRGAMYQWSARQLHHAPPYMFRNTFMAAADVTNQTLDEGKQGEAICTASRNVVVYHSADDLALRSSKIANARQVSRRLGHTGPYDLDAVPPNVVAVDCVEVSSPLDGLGHSYFRTKEVLRHVKQAILTGRVPGSEFERKFILPG